MTTSITSSHESEPVTPVRDVPGITRLVISLSLILLGCFFWYQLGQPIVGLLPAFLSDELFGRWERAGRARDPLWNRNLRIREWMVVLLVLGAIGLGVSFVVHNRSWLDPKVVHFMAHPALIVFYGVTMCWGRIVLWCRYRRTGLP